MPNSRPGGKPPPCAERDIIKGDSALSTREALPSAILEAEKSVQVPRRGRGDIPSTALLGSLRTKNKPWNFRRRVTSWSSD